MIRKYNFSDDEKRKKVADYREHRKKMSADEAAKLLGIGQDSLYHWEKKLGMKHKEQIQPSLITIDKTPTKNTVVYRNTKNEEEEENDVIFIKGKAKDIKALLQSL